MARVAVEDGASALTSGINYRTIRIREYDRVNHIIITALEKYSGTEARHNLEFFFRTLRCGHRKKASDKSFHLFFYKKII